MELTNEANQSTLVQFPAEIKLTNKTKETLKQAVLGTSANLQKQFNTADANWENAKQKIISEMRKAMHYPSAYISVPSAEDNKTRTLAQESNAGVKIAQIVNVSTCDVLHEIRITFMQDLKNPHDRSILSLHGNDAKKFHAALVKIGFYQAWNETGRKPQFSDKFNFTLRRPSAAPRSSAGNTAGKNCGNGK